MKRGLNIAALIAVAVGLIGLFAWLLRDTRIAVLEPAGDIAQAQLDILLFALLLSVIVVVPVFTLLIYFSLKYRASNSGATYRPEWGENRWLEGLWWGIPVVIIGVLGVVIYQTSHSLDPYKPLAGHRQLEVQVVALQWKWLFIYPEQGVATVNHLPMPVNTPVRFSMTAEAPMSAFWIPSLGSQVYAMNGMDSKLHLNATKRGVYTGYTTNINGEGYSKMTFSAKVTSTKDFDNWVENAQASPDAMTMNAYEELSKPSIDRSEKTYRLANAKLFSMIIDKYAHSHGSHGDSR